MTAVITTPTEMPEPLLPVATTPIGPAAGDFDRLITLWGAAFAGVPVAAAIPLPPGTATPDSPASEDPSAPVLIASAPRVPSLPLAADIVAVAAGELAPEERPRDGEDRTITPDAASLIAIAPMPVPTPVAPPPVREAGEGVESPQSSIARSVTITHAAGRPAFLRSPGIDRPPIVDLAAGVLSPHELNAVAPGQGLTPESNPAPVSTEPGRSLAVNRLDTYRLPTTSMDGDARAPRPIVAEPQPMPTAAMPGTTSPERLTPFVAAAVEEPRPPLVAHGDARVALRGRALISDDAATLDPVSAPNVSSVGRVRTIATSRDDAGDLLSRAPRDREGGPSVSSSDTAAVAGPGGAAPARQTDSLAADAHDRVRPEAPREVVEQITTRLRDVRSPGRHELSVRLDPPELGAVQIDARLDGARLHLVIRAEHAGTSDLLTDALPQLRDALVQQGFSPGTVSVHLGFDASGSRHFTRDGAPTFRPSQDGELPRPPQALAPVAARAVAVSDGLDVWA